MPRRKKGKSSQKSPAKPSPNISKRMNKDSISNMQNWLEAVKSAKNDFQFVNEISLINSDEESDEFECNLKELEVIKKKFNVLSKLHS